MSKCRQEKNVRLATDLMNKLITTAKPSTISTEIVREYLYTISSAVPSPSDTLAKVDVRWAQSAVDESIIGAYEYLTRVCEEDIKRDHECRIMYLDRLIKSGYRRDACTLLAESLNCSDLTSETRLRYMQLTVDLLAFEKNFNGLDRLKNVHPQLDSSLMKANVRLGDKHSAEQYLESIGDADAICELARLSSSLNCLDLKLTQDCVDRLKSLSTNENNLNDARISFMAAQVNTIRELVDHFQNNPEDGCREDLLITIEKFVGYFKGNVKLEFDNLQGTATPEQHRRLCGIMTQLAAFSNYVYPSSEASGKQINIYLTKLIQCGVYPDTDVFNKVLYGHAIQPPMSDDVHEASEEKLSRMMKCVGLMMKLNLQPNAETFETLFKACEHPADALPIVNPVLKELVHWMRTSGVQHTPQSFATMMKLYAIERNNASYLKELNKAMMRHPHLLNKFVFLPYFRMATRDLFMAPKAIHIFRSIEEDSPQLLKNENVMDSDCYRLLIGCCAAIEQIEEAFRIAKVGYNNLYDPEDQASVLYRLSEVVDDFKSRVAPPPETDIDSDNQENVNELLETVSQSDATKPRLKLLQTIEKFIDTESSKLEELVQVKQSTSEDR